MGLLIGIGITIGILVLEYVIALAMGFILAMLNVPIDTIKGVGTLLGWVVMAATAAWVAWDSGKIELKKYKHGVPTNQGVLIACVMLLFVVTLPWYLTVRYKIKNGTATLKEATAKPPAPEQIG